MHLIKPKKLEKGDTIALIAPSAGLAKIFPHRIEKAKEALTQLGFKVKLFPTLLKRDSLGKAGTATERVADIHNAFLDNEVKAIICAIGGLAANELLDKIDYNLIRDNPKIFCGYSNITLLHAAFQNKAGLVTFYGPSAMNQFGEYPKPLQYSIDYFLKAVANDEPIGKITPSTEWTDEFLMWRKEDTKRARNLIANEGYTWLAQGKAEGSLVGGCLSSLIQLKGTVYDVAYDDAILIIETSEGEDITKGSPLAYVDSALTDLYNMGVFDKIKGLVVGIPFGYTKEERKQFKALIKEHTANYTFPVLYHVNIGHADPIITVPLGVSATLDSENNIFSIDENGVETN